MVLGDAHRPILTSTSNGNDGPTHLVDLHLPSPASLSALTRTGRGAKYATRLQENVRIFAL